MGWIFSCTLYKILLSSIAALISHAQPRAWCMVVPQIFYCFYFSPSGFRGKKSLGFFCFVLFWVFFPLNCSIFLTCRFLVSCLTGNMPFSCERRNTSDKIYVSNRIKAQKSHKETLLEFTSKLHGAFNTALYEILDRFPTFQMKKEHLYYYYYY